MLNKILLTFSILSCFIITQAQVNPYPLVSIDTVQFVTASKLAANNSTPDYVNPAFKNTVYTDTVQLEGYVTFNPKTYGLSTTLSRAGCFLQKAATATPWGGIHVLLDRSLYPGDSLGGLDQVVKFFSNFDKGLKVKCTGKLSEFSGMTQMALLKIETEITNLTPATVQPKLLTVDVFQKNIGGIQTYQPATGEQWESSYIELRNVTVVDRSASGASRWNWALQDANGNKMKVYDVSGHFRNDNFDRDPATNGGFAPPPAGTTLSYVRGVVMEVVSGGVTGYYIAPLLPSDIGSSTFIPPTISNRRHIPVIANSSNAVKLSCRAIDDSTVASATMYYAVGATNNTYTAVTMTDMGGNIFEATVPAQANGSVVKYWFRAWDNGGHNSVDTASNALAYIVTDATISTIEQLQYSPFPGGASIWAGDTLTNIYVGGIVTASLFDMSNYPAIQNGTDPNSGIFFKALPGDSVAFWKRGDSIIVTSCVVTEEFNVTTLSRIGVYGTTKNFQKVSSFNPLPPAITTLPIDSVMAKIPAYTEPYEGMLVRFNNVYCVHKNPDVTNNNGEFSIYKDTTTTVGLRCDDDSKDIGSTYNVDSMVLKNKKYGFVQGLLYFSFSNWKLEPRDRADIDGNDRTPPVLILKGADTMYVRQNDAFVDPGVIAYDNFDMAVSTSFSGAVNTAVIDTYYVKYDAVDIAGNKALQLTRVVFVTPRTGISKSGNTNQVVVFPNPANDFVNVVFNAPQRTAARVTLTDLNGKVVLSNNINVVPGSNRHTIDLLNLAKGMYLVTIQLPEVNYTTRIVK